MKITFISIVLTFVFSSKSSAFLKNLFSNSPDCPTQSLHAKKCPTGSSRILDDTYPTQAVVISNSPYNTSNLSYQTPGLFILEAIKAYKDKDPDTIPLFIIPIKQDNKIKRIKQLVEDNLRDYGYPSKFIDKVIDKIVQADTSGYTWQQDYFETFYNPSTGQPTLRNFDSYRSKFGKSRKSTEEITSVLSDSSCLTTTGSPLPNDPRSSGNGEMGGNLEGLPGGGCLYGDNLGDGLAQSICQDKNDHSQIFTSWLKVGHVDEIIKITPGNKNTNVPSGCNFTINLASPMKALEILENNPNQKLLTPPALGVSPRPYYSNRLPKLCEIYQRIPTKKVQPTKPLPDVPQGSKGVYNLILPSNLYAKVGRKLKAKKRKECDEKIIKNMTNKDFVSGIKNSPKLFELNKLIETTMNKNLQKIKSTIFNRLPQCKPFIDVLKVPDYFYSESPANKMIETNGVKELSKEGDSISFFPSPTNGVFLNKTMIYSDNEVPAFRNFLAKSMKTRGNKARFIRTYEYSHMGQGNLHCSSHTIPYCRPRGKN
jgi:hypothetical protein